MKNARGFSLLEILIAAAILALVSMGFMRFMSNASRAQGNLSKKGEADTLSMAIRTVLANNKACVASAGSIALATPGPQDFIMRDANGNEMFRKGTTTNGILIEELSAEASPVDRGVQFVTLKAEFKKVGAETVGAPKYKHTFYFNVVVDGAGAAVRCFTGGENDGTFQILGQESHYMNYGSNQCGVLNVTCPSAGWGAPSYYVQNVGPTSCNYNGDGCPILETAAKVVRARGNWMLVSFRTDATLAVGVVNGCAAFTGVFGVTVSGRMLDAGGAVKHDVNVAHIQLNGDGLSTINRLIGLSSAPEMVRVTADQDYRFQSRMFVRDSGPSSGLSCGTTVTVTHYLENNAP